MKGLTCPMTWISAVTERDRSKSMTVVMVHGKPIYAITENHTLIVNDNLLSMLEKILKEQEHG